MAAGLDAHYALQKQELLKSGWTQQQVDSIFWGTLDRGGGTQGPASTQASPTATDPSSYIPTDSSEELPGPPEKAAPSFKDEEQDVPDTAAPSDDVGAPAEMDDEPPADEVSPPTPRQKEPGPVRPPSAKDAPEEKDAPKEVETKPKEQEKPPVQTNRYIPGTVDSTKDEYDSKIKQYSSVEDAKRDLGDKARDVPMKNAQSRQTIERLVANMATADSPQSEREKPALLLNEKYAAPYVYGQIFENGKLAGWVIRDGDTDKYQIYYYS